jgi:DNA invertase Pin-like site-specific DNA recombinase
MLDHLREHDIAVVWKLDRLSRSLKDLLVILEKIDAAKAGWRGERYSAQRLDQCSSR